MSDESKTGLLAKLNLFDSTLLVIGSVIGSGIFLTTGIIAKSLPFAEWILFVWVLGAVLMLFGGLTFAELGAMMPKAGGQYIYIREAYGPLAGFIYGWSAFLIIQTGGIAALAVGFAEYLSYFIPRFGLNTFILEIAVIKISTGQIIAIVSIGLLTMINYVGIRAGSSVQNFFTILKIIAIAVLVSGGLFITVDSGDKVYEMTNPLVPDSYSLIAAVGVGLIAVLWTFDGWYTVNGVASEIKNVKKNLPLSLILGISFIALVYLLVNIFYVRALPINEMAGVVRIGEKATTNVFGETYGSAMSALILISIFGCLSANIIYGPRVFFAMAQDGLFFKSLANVHTKYHTPHSAIIWQGVWAALLCLTGSYEQLFTYVVFAVLVFYIANALAVVLLRKKNPQAERPYKVWGYPVVPALFGLSMFWIMINTLIEKPAESLIGALLILSGLPIYFYWQKKSKQL